MERLGDQAATEIPVWERPCRLGFLLTGDPAQAEDLAQEALVRTRLATPLLTRGAVGGS